MDVLSALSVRAVGLLAYGVSVIDTSRGRVVQPQSAVMPVHARLCAVETPNTPTGVASYRA